MTDFDKILWGFIFSAIGIVFGWTLNQLGQWFRTRQEDKKNLKLVLFNLLETYFLFMRSDFEKIITKVTDKTFEKIPVDQRSEDGKKIMYAVYSSTLKDVLKPELEAELQIIHDSYQQSIKTLASIDPLTAYYLSGKSTIIQRFDTIENWFTTLKKQYPNDSSTIQSVSSKTMEIVKPDLVKEILDDLEKDIKDIAWKINPIIFYQSRKAIDRLKSKAGEEMDKEIERLLTQLMSILDSTFYSE